MLKTISELPSLLLLTNNLIERHVLSLQAAIGLYLEVALDFIP